MFEITRENIKFNNFIPLSFIPMPTSVPDWIFLCIIIIIIIICFLFSNSQFVFVSFVTVSYYFLIIEPTRVQYKYFDWPLYKCWHIWVRHLQSCFLFQKHNPFWTFHLIITPKFCSNAIIIIWVDVIK